MISRLIYEYIIGAQAHSFSDKEVYIYNLVHQIYIYIILYYSVSICMSWREEIYVSQRNHTLDKKIQYVIFIYAKHGNIRM